MFFIPMQHKTAGLSHNPLKAIVSPRPIAWVSSRGADGSINLAPYSFFNAVSEDPAMLFFSAAVLAGGQRKDSLRNIEETGEFTVNVVGEAQFDAMNISSGNFPYGDNEFIHAGLEMVASETVATPRVGGAAAAMECKLHDTIQLPRNSDDRGYVMVIGTITGIHVDDDVVVDGKIAYDRFVPVSRLGYRDYGRVTDVFEAARPSD